MQVFCSLHHSVFHNAFLPVSSAVYAHFLQDCVQQTCSLARIPALLHKADAIAYIQIIHFPGRSRQQPRRFRRVKAKRAASMFENS